jgi:hypothetical protein
LARSSQEIKPAQVEKSNLTKTTSEYGEAQVREFRVRSKRLYRDAMRTGLHSRAVRRDQFRFVVEEPTESSSQLFEQALRHLGVK